MTDPIYGPGPRPGGHPSRPGGVNETPSTSPTTPQAASSLGGVASTEGQVSFGRTLEIEFSRHANERMRQRNIRLEPSDLDKIDQAVGKAADRGSKDALLLLRDLGLVVNVKNRKVLTAIDADSMRDRVFTNIDSTVIIED